MPPKYSKVFNKQRGDIALWIALTLSLFLVIGAVMISGIITNQLQLTRDIELSERALYITDVALERGYFEFIKNKNTVLNITEAFCFDVAPSATCKDEGHYTIKGKVNSGDLCMLVESEYQGVRRRFLQAVTRPCAYE